MDLFLQLFPLFLWVLQIYPQSEKCLVLGLAPCQLHQRKIMIHNPVTSSHRDSQANRAVNRHFHSGDIFCKTHKKNEKESRKQYHKRIRMAFKLNDQDHLRKTNRLRTEKDSHYISYTRAIIIHKGSRVNRTVKRHFPKCAAFMNRISNNIVK